ncbi:MAG: glycoside hydrolase family 10 protein, partial [Dolichospermum sp.]
MKKISLKWQRQTKKLGFLAAMMTVSMVAFMMLSFPLNAQIPKSTELRGVWLTNIDSDVLFESNRLKQSLRTLHQLNFNTVYPAVWNWGYTLYPSKVAAKVIGKSVDPTPGLQKRDMLKEVISEGHKQNLTVIPWFEFGFMAPADSLLAKNRPTWLTNRRDGTKIVKEGTHNRVWLNPFRPDVQQFIQDLIVEIVKNYDIDGIQFDDHFGLPSELGYDA